MALLPHQYDEIMRHYDYLRLNNQNIQHMRLSEIYQNIPGFKELDEEQKDYRSLVHNSSTNISVPKTVSDTRMEIIGAWLECIAAESYRSVMPQFLEFYDEFLSDTNHHILCRICSVYHYFRQKDAIL